MAGQESPQDIVAVGYDRLAERYLEWSGRVEGDPRHRMLALLEERLSPGARVLDLGCGPGVPSTEQLARRYQVVGVDISESQLALARERVPGAEFIQGDFTELDFPTGSFQAVTAFYSVFHTPRSGHPRLFRRIHEWLAPGGLFLAALGSGDGADWTGDWLGVRMFFSSHAASANSLLLTQSGFELLVDEVVTMREPDHTVSFQWVLGQSSVPPQGEGTRWASSG